MPTLDAADDDLSVRSFPDYWWSSLPTQSKEKIDTQVNKKKHPKTKSTPHQNLSSKTKFAQNCWGFDLYCIIIDQFITLFCWISLFTWVFFQRKWLFRFLACLIVTLCSVNLVLSLKLLSLWRPKTRKQKHCHMLQALLCTATQIALQIWDGGY